MFRLNSYGPARFLKKRSKAYKVGTIGIFIISIVLILLISVELSKYDTNYLLPLAPVS